MVSLVVNIVCKFYKHICNDSIYLRDCELSTNRRDDKEERGSNMNKVEESHGFWLPRCNMDGGSVDLGRWLALCEKLSRKLDL